MVYTRSALFFAKRFSIEKFFSVNISAEEKLTLIKYFYTNMYHVQIDATLILKAEIVLSKLN